MKILGLGDNVVDVYRNLKCAYPGGNAVNISANAKKLGYESSYIGNFASDVYGSIIKHTLDELGVDTSKTNTIINTTSKKCIVDVVEGERTFISLDLGENYVGPYELQKKDLGYINDFDIIFTSCNAKIHDQIYMLAKTPGIITYDFGEKSKYQTKEYLEKTIPFIDIAQFSINTMNILSIKKFIQKFHLNLPILVTRGDKPPLFAVGDKVYEGYLNKVNVKDTMGAGDAFISAFVTKLVSLGFTKKNRYIDDSKIKEALYFASIYASDICMIDGAFGYKIIM